MKMNKKTRTDPPTREETTKLVSEMRTANANVRDAEKVLKENKTNRDAIYSRCTHQFYTEERYSDGHRINYYYECMVCGKEMGDEPTGGMKVNRDEKYEILGTGTTREAVVEKLFDLRREREGY